MEGTGMLLLFKGTTWKLQIFPLITIIQNLVTGSHLAVKEDGNVQS